MSLRQFQPRLVNYLPLRTGDGRSSSSGSEQSLVTVSVGTTCGSSSTTSEDTNSRDSDSISFTGAIQLSTSLDNLLQSTENGSYAICEGRCSPDGCSISSDDKDGLL